MKIQFTEEAWKNFEWFLDKDKHFEMKNAMDFLFHLLLRHAFWILIIDKTIAYLRIRKKLQKLCAEHPLLAIKYQRLLKIKIIIGILPWAVMAYGIYFRDMPSMIFYVFFDPFTLLWYAIFSIGHCIHGYLVFFRGGADFEFNYPFFYTRQWAERSTTAYHYAVQTLLFACIFFWIFMLNIQ